MTIVLSPKKVVYFITKFVVILFIANLGCILITFISGHDYVYGLIPLFDFNSESNVPTFLSSLLIFLCSCLLGVIALAEKKQSKSDYKYWGGLSLVFLFLAIDEFASIHELLTSPLRHILGTSGIFYYAWVLPYGLIALVIALLYMRFLFRLPVKFRVLSVMAGFIYITGAIVFELLGGYYFDIYMQEDVIFKLIATFEETLEIGGMLLFLYTLMAYIDSHHKSLTIRISSST